ncbi:hypothetical protein FGO68_gene3676 [Halteria grandinella]|uniref:Uncharacterized protein n=1 Tax=Halteria grandinella TaxID=5974 RepID=A0A8J8NL88_HALGN|nr:hypothetical protein FGO68_gene3676 [Halteria grandinella]
MESSPASNYKDYRFVPLPIYSPSYLMNNLTSNGGDLFVFANTAESQPKVVSYSKEFIEKGEQQNQPQIFQWKDGSDCLSVRYLLVQNKWHLVVSTTKGCQIYNQNATRLLFHFDSKKKLAEGKLNFFTSAATGFEKGTGDEFIAAGTVTGEIYSCILNGATFVKELAFQMTHASSITAMSGDPKSQTLAVGNSNGYVIIFDCDNQTEWKAKASVPTKDEIPVVSVGLIVKGGENYYAVAYANGSVKLITPAGVVVSEIGAHSRGINALTCHPQRPIFATCSDDTFVNVYEVTGETVENLDVNLLLSSKVNDFVIVGLAFGGDGLKSLIGAPYDYKNLTVWNQIL